MHRILLRTIVIDSPTATHDAERDFWNTALGASMRRGVKYPEYHVLENAAMPGSVMTQDIGDSPARIHLDIETDDVAAEVERLSAAGAEVVSRNENWTVLRDPAGLLFCVVPGEGDDFAANAKVIG